MKAITAWGQVLVEPGKPFERREFTIESVPADHAVVEVAGCGVCHTDITFFTGAVGTNKKPLVLGHEISGRVVAAGDACSDLVGRAVVIPAVLPCGECDLCRKGRDNICRAQQMPGNDFDGGFASHVVVPARFLCTLPDDLGDVELWHLSVVADAITTPYQSLVRSGLESGDLAVVIGVGGIGSYLVQHARNAGAKVIALDVDDDKLEASKSLGASHAINVRGMSERDVKKAVRGLVKAAGLPGNGWRVFETSGTGAGQATAFALLSFAGSVGIVGFTMEKVEVRLSNIMAFDADVFGNWGCRPEHYSTVVADVLAGRVRVADQVERRPLSTIDEVFAQALDHQHTKRIVLIPD